ncbi:MAG TPA: HlyD family efflux transporter periplasmic adaptor subunit [Bryobacteraceae bacterium]|jgi:HlyD family secretion protein|nr:HlyD family efflux transporter periplasmic adaptor subunit [Bryobacteraceae bacterium]
MDIPRQNATRRRVVRRVVAGAVLVGTVSIIGVVTSRLRPAAPTVEANTTWPDVVKRGEMLRQVRGLGTLVPEEIVYVPAPFAGRVLKLDEEAGTTVSADTVLVELKNPDMEQQVLDSEWALQTGESDLINLKAQIASQRVNQRADLATLQAQYRDAKAKNDRDEVLYKQGLMLELDYRLSKTAVEDLAARIGFEQERGKALSESLDAQINSKETAVKQLRAILQLRRDQVSMLKVRAGVGGVLQQVPVLQGQQIGPGTNLAIVVQPRKLKAALAIAETQAKDILVGQKAEIDTQNGIIPGHVTRIDPSVVNGTRTVDVKLEGALPPGAVPDKSVDGTILIERLADIVFMSRPVSAQAGGEITLFRMSRDGAEATRVKVKVGRVSVNTVEVVEGLKVGDRVILSDMSAMDSYDRIRLK